MFNPYRAWLGWEQARAPDYYELLGLDRSETDAAKISLATEKVIAVVRSHRPGPQAQIWSRLIDEIRAARECLTDPGLRSRYNASLERSTTFASATGDLQAHRLPTAIPPTPWAAGPAPIYDPQRGFVSVHPMGPDAPSAVEFGNSIPFAEADPLEKLAPRITEAQLGDWPTDLRHATPAAPSVLVLRAAPTAASFAANRAAGGQRTFPVVVVGCAVAAIAAVGLAVAHKQRQTAQHAANVTRTAGTAKSNQERPPNRREKDSIERTVTLPPATAHEPNKARAERSSDPAALIQALQSAKDAAGELDFSRADEQLARAGHLAISPQEKQAAAVLREAVGYAKMFHAALVDVAASLQPAETFRTAVGEEFIFVEGFDDSLVLRSEGKNTTYSFHEMPPALALALVDFKLAPASPRTKLLKGAYLALHQRSDEQTRQNARRLWEEAAEGGADIKHLLPILAEDFPSHLLLTH